MSSEVISKSKQQLLFSDSEAIGRNGTFSPNHRESIHRWYPYIEGYSKSFVEDLLNEFAAKQSRIYDPFGGTGTTVTTAAFHQHVSFYSEINPVMRLVIECKTNGLRSLSKSKQLVASYFQAVLDNATATSLSMDEAIAAQSAVFGDRQYFAGSRLVEVVALKQAVVSSSKNPLFQNLGRLALAAIAVASSEMKRAADLRYRSPKERLPESFSAIKLFKEKADQVIDDIDPSFSSVPSVSCLSNSALAKPSQKNLIDLLITSPPYINGTNYFRNTKLELWLCGFINSETELGHLRDQAMAAGINNISKRGRSPILTSEVEDIATQLDKVAYDKRIPELIRRYFSDTQTWLQNAFSLIRAGGVAVVDIGDSRYAGVHVPADELLMSIARRVGFTQIESRPVRKRTSKDGTEVKQVLLVLHKPSGKGTRTASRTDEYLKTAIDFGQELPHLSKPHSSRNWGHDLHSLCSYQGKLKPALAHFLVDRFTEPKQRVLDPLSGSGTISLECLLQGRKPLGNDLQELAFILTKAKSAWGDADTALQEMKDLIQHVKKRAPKQDVTKYSDFGFNGKLPSYFNEQTFQEVLAAREYMLLHECNSWERAIVYSSVLHILHGNRPYALSRRSHPVTPLKPKGDAEYRPLAPRLTDKVQRMLSLPIPKGAICGSARLGDFSSLAFRSSIDAVITSPPFAASTRFFSTNWMRLWFAGWEPEDFDKRKQDFLEKKQAATMDVYKQFFGSCAKWLRPGGKLILHLGKTLKCNMSEELAIRMGEDFELVYTFDEDVAGREKFGLKDQGATTSHQYLFLRRV